MFCWGSGRKGQLGKMLGEQQINKVTKPQKGKVLPIYNVSVNELLPSTAGRVIQVVVLYYIIIIIL